MKPKLSLKVLYRSPVKTILTFILLAAVTFALFSQVMEYAVTSREMKKAVETGYWNLYRRRPAHDGVEEEFLLDSTPSRDYEEFLNGENRYRALLKVNPVAAKALFEESKKQHKS